MLGVLAWLAGGSWVGRGDGGACFHAKNVHLRTWQVHAESEGLVGNRNACTAEL